MKKKGREREKNQCWVIAKILFRISFEYIERVSIYFIIDINSISPLIISALLNLEIAPISLKM